MSSSPISFVACVSAYREGELVHAAIRSALEAEPDAVIVFEGRAGDPCPDAPATDYNRYRGRNQRIVLQEGEWRTDAAKRTALADFAKSRYGTEKPLWAIWVDADEVLVNGQYLRDILLSIHYDDEANGVSLADPGNLPKMGCPIAIMEPDGRISLCRAKVLRLDLLKRYVVSSSVVESVLGGYLGEGNKPARFSEWFDPRLPLLQTEDALFAQPPFPCEPLLVHRHNLRHPARRPLRMSAQEQTEFKRESEARGIEVAE